MTEDEIRLVIKDAINQCESGEYRVTTLRNLLSDELGYSVLRVDEVIRYVADHGFDYYVDSVIAVPGGSYPPNRACYYGVDQLALRLRSLR